jgi:hypothetical protein
MLGSVPINLPPFGLRISNFLNTKLAIDLHITLLLNSNQGQDDPMMPIMGKHFLEIPGPTDVPDRAPPPRWTRARTARVLARQQSVLLHKMIGATAPMAAIASR